VGQVFLVALSLFTLFPIYYIVTASLKGKEEYLLNNLGLPHGVALENFRSLFADFAFVRWLVNSVLVTSLVLVFGLLVCCLAAFALRRYTFRIKGLLLRFIASLMLIPPIIAIVPLFEFFVRIRLINSLAGVIIIYIGFIIPFTIYLVYSFFVTIPGEMIEAGVIDGCRDLRLLFWIFIPLSVPAIVTSIVVNAMWVWNDLLVALIYLGGTPSVAPMTVTISNLVNSYGGGWELLTSAAFVSMVLPLVVFLSLQRYFVRGILSGAVKG